MLYYTAIMFQENLAYILILVASIFTYTQSESILIRVGIVFDEHIEATARVIADSLPKYVQKIGLDSVDVQTVNFDLHFVTNPTEEILASNLTTVIVAAENFGCSHLNTIKKTLPVYVISSSSEDCNRRDNSQEIFYLFPSNPSIISALLKATAEYAWTKAIVFERSSEEIHFSFSDMQHTREKGLDIMAFEAPTKREELIKTLQISRVEGVRAYILACPIADALSILEIAEELEFLTDNYHWFIPNVFVTQDKVAKMMQKGFRISFLYSPFITPTVELLQSLHNDTLQDDYIIQDVIVSLGHHVIHTTAQACIRTKDENCLEKSDVSPTKSKKTKKPIGVRYSSGDCRKRVYENVIERSKNTERRLKRDVNNAGTQQEYYYDCLIGYIYPYIFNYTMKLVEEHWGIIGKEVSVYDLHSSSFGLSKRSVEAVEINELKSNIDACLYKMSPEWGYRNDTCSYKLGKYMETDIANMLMTIEYVEEESGVRSPLVVEVFNTENNFEVNVTYKKLLTHDISLPKRPMRVGVVYFPPWLSWTETLDGFNETEYHIEGFLYDMLLNLSHSMGFNYEFIVDPYFGKDSQNLTKEQIEAKMCDFFLYPQSIHGGRLMQPSRVDLSTPFQTPHMYLLTKRVTDTESIDIWQFMLPFRENAWVVFWMTFILISGILAYINTKNPNEYQAISTTFGPNSTPEDHLGISNSLWFNYAAIAQQGADIAPKSKAGKCLTATWWAFVLLVLSAYTANMTAFMTQANQGKIETLEELANQQEFKYGIVKDNTMLKYLLPNARNKPYTTIYSYLKRNEEDQFDTDEQAFTKILEGNYYVIASYKMAVKALSRSCDFDMSGKGFYQHLFGLPFARGSVFTPLFDDHIKRLKDMGFLIEIEEKWFNLEAKCEQGDSGATLSEGQLDLTAFIGMYVFLIIGISIGFAICLIETGWIKCGGLGGFFGKARMYEIEKDKRENIKVNDMLEEEFKNWEGGWEVWKFKEWNTEGMPDPQSNLKANYAKWCHICGRTASDAPETITGKQEIHLRKKNIEKNKETPSCVHDRESKVTSATINEKITSELDIPEQPLYITERQDVSNLVTLLDNEGNQVSESESGKFSPELSRKSPLSNLMGSHSSLNSGSISLPTDSESSTPTTIRHSNSIFGYDEFPSRDSSITIVSKNRANHWASSDYSDSDSQNYDSNSEDDYYDTR